MDKITRRTVLSSIGSAGIATLGTVGLLSSGSQSASASVSMGTLSVSGDSATTQSGSIEGVSAKVSGQWSYEIQEGTPDNYQVVLRVGKNDETAIVGGATGSAQYMRFNDSYSVEGSITDTDLYSPSDFAATESGQTKEVEISLDCWFQLYDAGNKELATANIQDTATITVTQSSYDASLYGEVSGEGGLTVHTKSD